MQKNSKHINYFDSDFRESEQLPRDFSASFYEVESNGKPHVQVLVNGERIGDIINDNSSENDFYRYHDVFHYTFATMLSWSPCTRSMMKRKRKSSPLVDELEDGARATITEEAISLMIFNEAKRCNYFIDNQKINKSILKIIKGMTSSFEVKERTEKEWEKAIIKGYEMFRLLMKNKGGNIYFDRYKQTISYKPLS
jgi:hypothetical protein